MNLPTLIMLAVVAAAFVGAIAVEVKKRKKGKGSCSCGGGCSGCGMNGMCHPSK